MKKLAPLLIAAALFLPSLASAQSVQCVFSDGTSSIEASADECDIAGGSVSSYGLPSSTNSPTGGSQGVSGASNGGSLDTAKLQGYESSIVFVINAILVPLLIAVAFIVFIWGVFKYFILGAAEPESRKEGTQFILWGIVGFVVIFSVWGLVNLLMGTLSLTSGGHAPIQPTL